jgi:hypothetical protein
MVNTKTQESKFCQAFKIKKLDQLPVNQYETALAMLNKKAEKQGGDS